jgi:hypothetical protein
MKAQPRKNFVAVNHSDECVITRFKKSIELSQGASIIKLFMAVIKIAALQADSVLHCWSLPP